MNFYTKSRFPAIETLTYINLSSTTNKYNSGKKERTGAVSIRHPGRQTRLSKERENRRKKGV